MFRVLDITPGETDLSSNFGDPVKYNVTVITDNDLGLSERVIELFFQFQKLTDYLTTVETKGFKFISKDFLDDLSDDVLFMFMMFKNEFFVIGHDRENFSFDEYLKEYRKEFIKKYRVI